MKVKSLLGLGGMMVGSVVVGLGVYALLRAAHVPTETIRLENKDLAWGVGGWAFGWLTHKFGFLPSGGGGKSKG